MDLNDLNKKYKDNIKIIKIVVLIMIIVGAVFIKYFMDIKKDGEISRAKQALYQVTSCEKKDTELEYSPEENYLNNEDINKEYYPFKVIDKSNVEYKFNYLVSKDGFEIYVCDRKGFIIPFEDYTSNDSMLGNYFEELKKINYDDIPPATRTYFEKNGGIIFMYKVEEIMTEINIEVVDQWGGIVKYVDLIINGVNPKSLNESFLE